MNEQTEEQNQSHAEPATSRRDLSAGCPMSSLLEMLTRPWTLHILWVLSTHGPMRFGALRRSVEGISARLLTLRLRSLEAEGLVRRTAVAGKNPEVTYSPTPQAGEMNQVMEHLHRFSERWGRGERQN